MPEPVVPCRKRFLIPTNRKPMTVGDYILFYFEESDLNFWRFKKLTGLNFITLLKIILLCDVINPIYYAAIAEVLNVSPEFIKNINETYLAWAEQTNWER